MEETIVREISEETGLQVEKPEHIDVVNSITKDENGDVKYHFVIIDYFEAHGRHAQGFQRC